MPLFCGVKSLAALLQSLRGQERLWIPGLLCLVLTNFMGVIPPRIIRHLMDAVSQSGTQSLTPWLLGLLAATLARGLFMYWMRQTLIVMSRLSEQRLKETLFARILAAKPQAVEAFEVGDLTSRLTEDVGKIRMFIGPGLMYSLNLLVMFLMVIGVMLTVSPVLTFWVLTPMPFLVLGIYLLNLKILSRSAAVQAHLGKMTVFVQESLGSMKLLQAFSAEPSFIRRFGSDLEEYRNKNMAFARADALFFPLATTLVGLSTLITVWMGGHLMVQGKVSLGNLAEFILYINMLTWPVTSLGWVASIYQQAKAAQARLEPILGLEGRPHRNQGYHSDQPPAWKIRNLKAGFSGGFVLELSEFDAKPGQFIGITGTVGSGKSTLWKLLTGRFPLMEGSLKLGGVPLSEWKESSLHGQVAWVPQEQAFFNDTLGANLRLGAPEADDATCREVLNLVELGDWAAALPQGLQTGIGERGVQLSGGQKQRLALARAWLRQPRWMVLDDALSALDSGTEDSLMQKIMNAKGDRGIILISLKIKPLVLADCILVLDAGKVVGRGTHNELLHRCSLYRRMHDLQQQDPTTAMVAAEQEPGLARDVLPQNALFLPHN